MGEASFAEGGGQGGVPEEVQDASRRESQDSVGTSFKIAPTRTPPDCAEGQSPFGEGLVVDSPQDEGCPLIAQPFVISLLPGIAASPPTPRKDRLGESGGSRGLKWPMNDQGTPRPKRDFRAGS